jgi:hypothetical protein
MISQISLVQHVATGASTEPVLSFGYRNLFIDLVPQSWALAVNSSRHPRVVRHLLGRVRAHFKAAFLCSAIDHRLALLSYMKCNADERQLPMIVEQTRRSASGAPISRLPADPFALAIVNVNVLHSLDIASYKYYTFPACETQKRLTPLD